RRQPEVLKLSKVSRKVIVVLDRGVEGRHVAEFEQVARLQRIALYGECLVAASLGEFHDLAGDGEALLGVRCPPNRHVAVVEHRRQCRRVGQSSSHEHSLVTGVCPGGGGG